MATETSKVLGQETGKVEDYGLYNQGKLKLNFNKDTNQWTQQYEPVKKSKVFIPPIPTYKEATTPTIPSTTPTVPTPSESVKVATPLIQQRTGESPLEKRTREDNERFGPGQNPMQTADRIVSMFTPGNETYDYYETKGALKINGNTLTVNFDAIDEKGGYGLQQSKLGKVVPPLGLLGRGMKFAEKGMMEGTVRNFIEAGIITSDNNIKDTNGILPGGFEGTYNFTLDKVKYDNYITNAPIVSKALTDNRELQGKLGKLDRVEQDEFISKMAINMAKDDDTKNAILNALQKRSNGATSAVIAAYTGEYLDLDRKTIFGNDFYPDTFKAQYNSTLAELKSSQNNEPSSDTSSNNKQVENEERKKLIEDLDNLLKDKKKNREPNRQDKGSITGSTEGSGKAKTSGPPSRTVKSGTTKPGT